MSINMQIQSECQRRKIMRLCHFTQSRNLAHIFGDQRGVLSTQTLKGQDLPRNVTDSQRWDNHEDLICCSIEYPNTYYFTKSRAEDKLFKDWVVLLIKPDYLWQDDTLFCPRNAAAQGGQLLHSGFTAFQSLFAQSVQGTNGNTWVRNTNHLSCSPTDAQAEVLVKEPIRLDDIMAVGVQSEEQVRVETRRLALQNITRSIPFVVCPDFFTKATVPTSIQKGIRVSERQISLEDTV